MDEFPEAPFRALIRDSSDKMMFWRKPGAEMVRARPRVYSYQSTAWFTDHFGQLEAAGMAVRYPQATYFSVAIAVPKGSGFRMVVMSRLEESGLVLEGCYALVFTDTSDLY